MLAHELQINISGLKVKDKSLHRAIIAELDKKHREAGSSRLAKGVHVAKKSKIARPRKRSFRESCKPISEKDGGEPKRVRRHVPEIAKEMAKDFKEEGVIV